MKFLAALLLLCAAAVFVALEVERNRPEYLATRNEERRLKLQLDDLRAQNDQLRAQVGRMKDDVFYLEKHAREKFGYAASNEIIYRFDK
jgi:cell division protein FtsB